MEQKKNFLPFTVQERMRNVTDLIFRRYALPSIPSHQPHLFRPSRSFRRCRLQSSEVSIRRRPPNGASLHNVGTDQFAFKVSLISPSLTHRPDWKCPTPGGHFRSWYKLSRILLLRLIVSRLIVENR